VAVDAHGDAVHRSGPRALRMRTGSLPVLTRWRMNCPGSDPGCEAIPDHGIVHGQARPYNGSAPQRSDKDPHP
jgi:hypothetical protein